MAKKKKSSKTSSSVSPNSINSLFVGDIPTAAQVTAPIPTININTLHTNDYIRKYDEHTGGGNYSGDITFTLTQNFFITFLKLTGIDAKTDLSSTPQAGIYWAIYINEQLIYRYDGFAGWNYPIQNASWYPLYKEFTDLANSVLLKVGEASTIRLHYNILSGAGSSIFTSLELRGYYF